MDGLPLAIELIAARVRWMSAEALLSQLTDQLVLSADGMRAIPARQKKMLNAIGWSYNSLPENEQTFFRRLGVFTGGWTLEQAEVICSGDGLETDDIPVLLTRLLEKSLVSLQEQAGQARYQMLVTIRQFAHEKLSELNETERARDRHLDFFRNLAEEAEVKLHGSQQPVWLERLEVELDNLRAALRWGFGGRKEAGFRLASSLWLFLSKLISTPRYIPRHTHPNGSRIESGIIPLKELVLYPFGGVLVDLSKHAFFEGKIVPLSEANISIATHGFLYGTAVFGGVRAYWNEEKNCLFVFRPYDHFRRLLHSARMMAMQTQYDEESLIQLTLDLLRTDNWKQDLYLRPTFYKADLGIGVRLHDLKDEFCMFVMAYEPYVKNETDAHVTISSWRRIDDNVIPARGKVAGAYANSALIKTDANRAGFDEALVLDNNGHISEGSAMNIFMLRDGILVTPPVTDNILEGITRRSVIELARKELGLTVIERSIDRTEAYICEEMFMTGTAAQIVAVTNVDHHPVGAGVMGPITTKLRAMYEEALRGKNKNYEHWNVAV